MRPRVYAAQISHETNVFSSVKTDLEALHAAGLAAGDEIIPLSHETSSAFGGFETGAALRDFELIPVVSVWATPSGIVTKDAIAATVESWLDALRRAARIDGVLLALHGAMVTEIDEDGDAYILEQTRDVVGPDVPIVATLDLHANISPRMVAAADILIGYDTYPHVDMAERAEEACGLVRRLIDGEIHPVSALVKPPMLPTSQRMMTNQNPMKRLIARAHEREQDPRIINVTVAGGFPASNVPEAGLSILVTTNGDPELAHPAAHELAAVAWEHREEFLGGVTSFDEAAAIIKALPEETDKPLVIVDIGDNPWTGGPGDSVKLVRFLRDLGVNDAAVALVKDSDVVRQAGGIGETTTVMLGAKTDELHGEPLVAEATTRMFSNGRYVNEGPMMAGLWVNLGDTVVLDIDGIEVIVTSRAETPIDLNVFRSHGIDPTKKRVIGLKGKGHFRAAFEPIAREIILVEGPGITGADLSRLNLDRVRRPIWPLDPDTTFESI